MGIKEFLQLLMFLSSHLDEFLEFVHQIMEDWNAQPQRLSADMDVTELEPLMTKFPNVYAACNTVSVPVGEEPVGVGPFLSLITLILANSKQIIDLINLFRDLFKKTPT